ncbi:MAG: hypothetical protein HZB38_01955 [Planctomycetes bacterium]|nr:hypothetical protein [Planctomycetota bacterium]
MTTHALVMAIVACLLQSPAKLDPPPAPDFSTPVDYADWLKRRVVGEQREDQNAAGLYDAILNQAGSPGYALLEFKGPRTQAEPVDVMAPWDPSAHPDWEAAYQKTLPKIEQFRLAAARPYIWWGVTPRDETSGYLLTGIVDRLGGLRRLCKGAADAAWRAPNGKIDDRLFLPNYRAILGAARQIERDPLLISQLVGCVIRLLAYSDLLRAAQGDILSDKQRSAVLTFLKGGDEAPPPLRYPVNGELAIAYDFLQAVHKNGGKYGIGEGISGVMLGTPTLKGDLRADVAKSRDALKRYYAAVAELSEKPFTPELRERIDSAAKAESEADPLFKAIVAGMGRSRELFLRCDAHRRATRLVYELLVFRDKNGRWPAALSDLPPEIDRTLRIDPFSNKPFAYKLVDGEPLLYSVAQNGKDDGGTTHDERWGDEVDDADFVFWPVQK